MADGPTRANRREQILQAFAAMLETHPGSRITTAALAAHVGVSEAALYRHFPSKAKMIDGLIAFAEATVFERVGQIVAEPDDPEPRCGAVLTLLLAFCERNPDSRASSPAMPCRGRRIGCASACASSTTASRPNYARSSAKPTPPAQPRRPSRPPLRQTSYWPAPKGG